MIVSLPVFTYLEWVLDSGREGDLPELILAVPLDGVESPDNPIDSW